MTLLQVGRLLALLIATTLALLYTSRGEADSLCSGTDCIVAGVTAATYESTTWSSAGPAWVADWTLLVYVAGDVDKRALAAEFAQDLEEIRKELGGSALLRIVVQQDYPESGKAPSDHRRPSRRYGFYRGRYFDPETMEILEDGAEQLDSFNLGETDTSNAATLQDFLEYGVQRFPARRYWVIVIGHGDGWNGIASDACVGRNDMGGCLRGHQRREGRARLELRGLASAFEVAAAATEKVKTLIRQAIANDRRGIDVKGRRFSFPNTSSGFGMSPAELAADAIPSNKIDVVDFSACYMANLEVAYALRDSVRYLFATSEIMPNQGSSYSSISALAQDLESLTSERLVEALVRDYVRTYVEGVSVRDKRYNSSAVSAVGLNLDKLEPLVDAIAFFREQVLEARPDGFSCHEVKAIHDVAKRRAHSLAELPRHLRYSSSCVSAINLQFTDGRAAVRGELDLAEDEYPTLQCGVGAALSGPQHYYRFRAEPGRAYRVRANMNFPGGQAYMFVGGAEACDQSAIEAQCEIYTTGPLEWRELGEMSIELALGQATEITVVIDSSGAAGRYILEIEEADSVNEPSERQTSARYSSVDLAALFEVLAGPDRYKEWMQSDPANTSCTVAVFPDQLTELLAPRSRDAALRVLDAIGRRHLEQSDQGEMCGTGLEYAGQYREVLRSSSQGKSPFVIEAQKVNRSDSNRRTGVSVLFGDVYRLMSPDLDGSDFEAYQASTFNKRVGWTSLIQACVEEIAACRNWTGEAANTKNPCLALPF